MKKEVTIIGAGLVGSLLSIYLAKRGYSVSVYERRGDMRNEKVEAGRSINLALSDRGIKALTEVGIAEEVLQMAIPMHGRYIHNLDGSHAIQPYGKEGQFINSVSRRDLNCKLMDLAENHGIQINFNQKLQGINFDNNTLQFEFDGQTQTKNFELLFGSDGAYSAARMAHMLQHNMFEYQQHYID
ncbi:MAG TPA: NAD(P)/FAD-dependent oxidoreductase, partial [Flavisolibacter sp.]